MVGMETHKLTDHDEQLRAETEREAAKHWPGARVVVHAQDGQYRAAVHLPEDGMTLAASAERSELHETARAALDEVMHTIKRQRATLLEH